MVSVLTVLESTVKLDFSLAPHFYIYPIISWCMPLAHMHKLLWSSKLVASYLGYNNGMAMPQVSGSILTPVHMWKAKTMAKTLPTAVCEWDSFE